MTRFAASATLAAFLLVSTAAAAQTATPTVKEACAADVAKLCSGGAQAPSQIRQCMMAHKADLSPGCKEAIMAARAAKKAAAAQSAPMAPPPGH